MKLKAQSSKLKGSTTIRAPNRATQINSVPATQPERSLEKRFTKEFHVSPFFGMNLEYEWRFSIPGERLSVLMTNLEQGSPVFCAGMECRRRAITRANLMRVLVRYPLQPLRLHAAIYWHAGLLYLKRMPFFSHPKLRQPEVGANGT